MPCLMLPLLKRTIWRFQGRRRGWPMFSHFGNYSWQLFTNVADKLFSYGHIKLLYEKKCGFFFFFIKIVLDGPSWHCTEFNKANVQSVLLPVAASFSTEEVGVVAADALTSFSSLQLFRLQKVILALSTWNRGISAREKPRRITMLYQNVVLIKNGEGQICTYLF